MGLGTRLGMSKSKMAVCTEESVSTVQTKRLKENIDIKKVKCVKCSPDNSCLLVQRLDFTLHLICIKTGQVHFVCKDVRDFMWSLPAKTTSLKKSPAFSILRNDGTVELFETKERRTDKQCSPEENCKEKLVSNVGSLTETMIKAHIVGKGEEMALKCSRLVYCKQGAANDEDRMHCVTLLFDGYLVVVLSFSILLSPDVLKWFEMVKHVSAVPFLLPQQAITDVKASDEMLFILYKHGVIIVYNLSNSTFYGWIDVFLKAESVSDTEVDAQQKRPSAKILDIDENMSTVLVCDDTNNVTKINLDKYYQHFPSHLHSRRDGSVNDSKVHNTFGQTFSPGHRDVAVHDPDVEKNLFGDTFWRAEVLSVSRELDSSTRTDTKMKGNFVRRKESNLDSETRERDDFHLQTPWSDVIVSHLWMKDFTSLDMYCSLGSFLLWLEPKERADTGDQLEINRGLLCCYVDWRRDYLVNIFIEKTFVASGGHSTRPLYLMTSSMIGLAVFGTTQNELVNKVIMYENVAMAEKLCYLNDWDHFAVPVSALEAALKHEQLDTVAFYLKTKGKAFTTIATESEAISSARALSPLSPGSFNSRQLITKPTHSEDVFEQITSVVNLLVTAIKTSSKRKHSVQFTSQLLQMSFDYVNGLMQDAVNYIERQLGQECDREKIHEILSYLTEKTMELRWFLYGIPPFTDEARRGSTGSARKEKDSGSYVSSETQEIIFKKWSGMDDKDVIGDAILNCRIPLAQVYFLDNGESFSAHDGSLRYIMESGMNLVLDVLARKDIATAIAMLKNMGEDVVELLRNICLKTFDRSLRDYLIEQLTSWDELKEEEIRAFKFLTFLESIYDNQSFESCQIRKLQHTKLEEFNDLGLLQKSFDPTSPSTKTGFLKTGSIAPQYHVSMVSRVSDGYCEVLMDWVIGWDQETRERVLLEKFFSDEKAFQKEIWNMVSGKPCWQYLKAHSEIGQVIEWISSSSESSQDSQVLPALTLEARSDLSECSCFLIEVILDELTRKGLYSKKLLTNFPLLLRHLCRTGTLFTKAHPLHGITSKDCQDLEQTLQEGETDYSLKLFHKEMMEYCSKHNFMNLLYYYLDFYRLCQTIEECEVLVPKQIHQEVDMLLKFRLAGLFPSDLSVICSMSFSNSTAVLSTSNPSLINMLSNHRPIMAIATCLYAPVDLSQILQPNSGEVLGDIWQLDETLLRSTLSCYPRLCSALFPRTGNQKLSEDPDITLYKLLQGNCSFEISSLFAWQSTNTLATRGGLLSDMPHFSQKTLVEKFAHKETLTYVYFLKHGRPSFAFITFMSKYQHRKYIPKTSISKATNKAYQLAITHFGNNRTAYSCVAFLELLGVDTLFLRIDIEAARRILHHGDKDELQCQTADELKNAVVVKLLKGSKDRQYKPKALIAILEDSTRNLISKEGLDRSSREASQFWSLPIMFCRSHNMTLTPAFLIDCAKVDKWLAFLCHAQAAQFPKNQVLSVVQHYFETNNLKEHLHQALVNVVSVNSKEAGHARRKGKFPPTRRDVRSQYLSRVIGASSSPVSKSDPLAKSIKENTELTNVLSEKTEPAHDVEPSEKDEPRHDMELESKKEVKVDDCEDDNDVNETEAKTLNEAMATNVGDINPETSPDNLFDVLSLCNETTESWRAILAHSIALKRPLFAVLAACYKDVNLVDCMCVWLCSVHDKEILHPALTNIADIHCWTLDDLQSLILTISKFGADVAHCLAKAFYLFDPNNMLLPLMRFYEAFSIHMDFVAAADQLSNFVLHHKSVLVNEDLQSQMVIGDLTWCEKISDGVVQNMLRSCQTMHTQVQLLRLLCHSRFGNGFSIRVPDFKKLYKISHVLEEGSVFARCVDLTSDESERERVLEELLQQQRFTEAQDYATLVDIPSDKVSLHQIIQKKKDIQASRLWENERERIAFWESCDRYLEEQNCATAGHFFEEESTAISVSSAEKATLLCLAFNWFSGRRNSGRTTPKSLADQAELECQMWLCIINDRVKSAEEWKSKTSLHNFTCCNVDFNVLQEQFLTIEGNSSHHISDNKVQKVLKEIIGELLDEGQITQARRLSVLFGLSTTDLDIVLSCIFLAQEIVSPESLEEDIKALLTPRESYTLSNSLKSSGSFIESLSQSQKSTDDGLNKSTEDGISTWTMVGDNLATMENLASSCRSGRICCSRVIVAYKICQTLGLVFVKVVGTDPFDLLCSLLGSSFDQRYQLAAQYIKSFNLDSNKIAQFVAKSVSTSLNVYTGSEVLDDKVLIFNPASREDMNNVMSLAEDRLVLGGFLFQEALLLAKRRKTATPSSSALTMEVELLIHAHHCQTLACNTEGISSILKLAQLCTLALTDANEYLLMVRLLTGIGRFTEMTYIFQALMDHHHFELLVKKGTDNENKLKTALLKYLDKYHFEDTEKHLLVAYRFNMHREVAISLKTSADLQVKKLVKRELNANSEVRSMLVSIAQSYTYAMENFKEEGCLLQALECAKKHRLVELQKHLLPTGMVILDLNDKSLGEFLAKYNNFFEAYIVADAYNKRSLDTWVEPLFNHVILGGDFKYFNEICSVFQVPTAILSELVVRYRSELQRNSSAIVHMKRVMRFERDILSRYKLAVELGYRDEIESIRQSEAGALVRDRRE